MSGFSVSGRGCGWVCGWIYHYLPNNSNNNNTYYYIITIINYDNNSNYNPACPRGLGLFGSMLRG